MKRVLCVLAAAILMLSVASCSVIRGGVNRAVDAVRHAVTGSSPTPASVTLDDATPTPDSGSEPDATATPQAEQPVETGVLKSEWPDGIPSYVPPFQYGATSTACKKEVGDGTVTYSIGYTGVTREQVDEYCERLKDLGYELQPEDADGSHNVTCFLDRDGKLAATIVILWSSDGVCGYAVVLETD